jgi:hypothetical protein
MKKFELTRRYFENAKEEFKKIAKLKIKMNFESSAYWVFGEELAVLRLLKAYQKNGEVKYSDNLGTWFFKLDAPSFYGEFIEM